MPSVTRAVEVTIHEAEELADLYGIAFDLNDATLLCEKAIAFGESDPRDYDVVEGLVAAALVKYGRCFGSGVRLGLSPQDIAQLDPTEQSAHEYFKALRDKFVAHSVNPFEETYVTVSAHERDGVKSPIQSIGPGRHRVVLSSDTAVALAGLISSVKNVMQRRVSLEEKRLLSVLQALPLETIHAGDLHTPRPIRDSDVYKSRAQRARSSKQLKGARRKRLAP